MNTPAGFILNLLNCLHDLVPQNRLSLAESPIEKWRTLDVFEAIGRHRQRAAREELVNFHLAAR